MATPKILFTTPVLEHPPAGGPQLRIENSIKALAKLSELHVVSRVAPYAVGQPEGVAHLQGLCHAFSFVPSVSGLRGSRSYIARGYRKFFSSLQADFLEKDANYLCRYAATIKADIIWFGYGCISFPLIKKMRSLLPKSKFVCDTDSVWSRFILRELDVEKNPERRKNIEKEGRAKEIEEKETASLCDVTTAVSEVDAAYYKSIAPHDGCVHIFSNVLDLDAYASAPAQPAGFHAPAVFLGGSYYSEYSPMVRAAQWVIHEVMPRVWQKNPQAHVYLVGSGSNVHCAALADKNVTVTGKVPSVLPYLCNAACSLVPLAFESGTRFKILESGACGVPVVSTTLGAEGIPVTHEHDCLIADKPEDFASAVIRLLENMEFGKRMGQNCRELVRAQYSIDSLMREAKSIMTYLHVGPRTI